MEVKKVMKEKSKNYLIIIIISIVFIAGFNIILSFIMQNIVDSIIMRKDIERIIYLFLILIGVNVLYPFVYRYSLYLSKKISLISKEETIKDITNKELNSSLLTSENIKDSQYIMLLNEDLENYSSRWDKCYIPIIKLSISISFALFYGFYYSPPITISVILLSFIYYHINNKIYLKVSNIKEQNSNNRANTNQFVHDSIKNIGVLRILNRIPFVNNKTSQYLNKEGQSKIEYTKTETLSIILSEASIQLIEAIVLLSGIYLKIKGEVTFGVVIGLWNGLIGSILWSIVEFPYFFKELSTVKNSKVRINRFLNHTESDSKISVKLNEDDKNLLNIESLKFKYNNSNNYLNYKNISIPKTGITIIKGRSGSGKSTLAKILAKLYKDDEDFLLHEKVTYIPQEPEIFPLSIKENIVFDRNVSDNNIIKTLQNLKFNKDFIENRNLNNQISKASISKGEAYRINLARLVYNESDIVIMDEPFASLDEDNIMILVDIIKEMAETKSIIILTHIYTDIFEKSNIYEIGVSL